MTSIWFLLILASGVGAHGGAARLRNGLVLQQSAATVWTAMSGLYRGSGSIRFSPSSPLHQPFNDSTTVVTVRVIDFQNLSFANNHLVLQSHYLIPTGFPRVSLRAAFGTLQKDGSLVELPAVTLTPNRTVTTQNTTTIVAGRDPLRAIGLRSYASFHDQLAIYSTGTVDDGRINHFFRYCLDLDCNQFQEDISIFSEEDGMKGRVFASSTTYTRVAGDREWRDEIRRYYQTLGISSAEQIPPGLDIDAFSPAEIEWCQADPSCSSTEPSSSAFGFVLVTTTLSIFGVAVLVSILTLLLRRRQANRKKFLGNLAIHTDLSID